MSLNRKFQVAAVAALIGFSLAASSAMAQAKHDLSSYAGRWMMDPSKTKMGRFGPNGRNIDRDPTFTWVFTPAKQGLKMEVFYKWPQAKPERTMTVITDEKPHPCDSSGQPCLTTGGNPQLQTYSYYYMNPHMIARLFYTGKKVEEYSTYATSENGKVLTIISWSPETPEYQNIQVFNKQP